jgi:2-hydroxychromene-2-carboxylate isomerase
MGKPVKLECFFDCSSPWTYLGFHNVQPIAARYGVTIEWKPILVGGIFNEVNKIVYTIRETEGPKQRYADKDLKDWARRAGLIIHFPPQCGHPVNAVKCMRGCIVMQGHGKLVEFARAAFEALWIDGRDLASDAVLSDLCATVGVDVTSFLAAIASTEIKSRLRENTDEAIRRGAFGSPTFFIDDTDMYFGNDRLVLVEDAIRRRQAM